VDEAARDQLTLAYLKQKDNYARVADLVRGLIEHDPTTPEGTIYTIRSRPKKEARLIEKIDQHNGDHPDDIITIGNFAGRVDDLVGLRVVCLLPSAVAKVDALIRSLVDEGRLTFVRDPVQKRTFDIPVDPKDRPESALDLQYTGYASNHYVVELGAETAAPANLRGLRVEIQVRTIFEEAWGELDHPRYELSRSGVRLPDGVRRGFYILGAQLAVNAVNAQYLTDELVRLSTDAETRRVEDRTAPIATPELPLAEVPAPTPEPPAIDEAIARRFGFMGTVRTRAYARRRLAEHAFINKRQSTVAEVDRILNDEVLALYEAKYREVFGRDPFRIPELRDQDSIVAVNFALFYDVQPVTAADGLVAILKDRQRRERKSGVSDTTPPDLLEFSITPRRVRASERDASITVAAHLRDELSGVAGAGYTSSPSQVRFRSPNGQQFVDAVFSSHSHLVSGTPNDGVFSDTVRIPRYSETGAWVVESVLLVDQVGNMVRLDAQELNRRHLPTTFDVVG
jgi:ppGpp synthetase/RelA/SpoT-type nucleotidyltranferase